MRIITTHFPIRTRQVTAKRLKAPWLTTNMIKCLRNKHILYNMYRKGQLRYSVYKKFSEALRELINLSKTAHKNNLFRKSAGDSRAI